MSDTDHDDFQELSKLLFKATERYCSVRAEISHTIDGAIAEESNWRFVDWRFGQPGGSGLGVLRTEEGRRAHGPDVPRDFYLEYEDSKEHVRLWHEIPNLWREEIYDSEGRLREAEVHGGKNGPRWTYERYDTEQDHAVYMPRIPERQETDTQLSFMLDPSEDLFYYALLDDAAVHKTGRKTTTAGREAVEVQIETISWGYPPSIFHGYWAPDGTTDHLLLVDIEVGTVLRAAARLEDREFYIAEVTEISYDEEFPENTFRLELPGVEFEQFDLPDYEK